ncbi:SH3 domain-containing protein [Salinimicrobium terrae]|uniref:SH3 domain-containing protein n=1 Tax=Salinimicrobium terrae TaxID=470866 RepID=UPI0003F7BEE2|nr:SH3 domain-containing protein [Salinimicrobium terrae]
MKFPLLILLFFSSLSHSQTATLEELQEKRQELKHNIIILQDSLTSISEKINEFPIQDVSQPVGAYGTEGAALRKEPDKKGEVILTLNKKTTVQVVDLFRGYYLVCIAGNCGYVHKSYIRKNKTK